MSDTAPDEGDRVWKRRGEGPDSQGRVVRRATDYPARVIVVWDTKPDQEFVVETRRLHVVKEAQK